MRLVVECGQHWWKPRCWRRGHRQGAFWWRPLVWEQRRIGTAIGPLMFLKAGVR
jgi:hypothetical protein